MRLDQELVQRNLCESRMEAQELIAEGSVFVDGILSLKQTKQVTENSVLIVTKRRKFVSRGGEKLEGALTQICGDFSAISLFCRNKNALDVGSSTGGFSDCLISHDIRHVDAVDVGTLQLHPKLQADSRISLYENTDIRDFKTVASYDIIVADLSFIPLLHVFDRLISLGTTGTTYILLLKPQFEVGKGNTKKGIVKDAVLIANILERYRTLAEENDLNKITIFPCSIQGGDGNQEYFLSGIKS
jgi:23S rRNA (cytidine1920-2'-O)/16S rRNA (cytidine1409-2'-O)-methyltransferase